ncbi:unnamed protein product [Menidia menidia]|uniref:(Atlantic silverside) hypothetical protein n=1 Tax=Menidia menidia TaxID=238744 RepID=A0A8S4AEP3_9TELE|nr:unnamed protein product [Menidia menidia]
MSAADSPSSMESKLEALECHFTWDLDASRSKLSFVRDLLEDMGNEEGFSWLGQKYNLLGFLHHLLDQDEEARRLFCRATEAFRQMRNEVSDEGPWLVVNYGNLAWLSFLMGEPAQSRGYLATVHRLRTEYPSPSEDEPHPEICAEKAWTLMKFGKEKKLKAVDLFQRAIRMQPDRVEWQTSRVIALSSDFKWNIKDLGADIIGKMRVAKEHDPDNTYLAAFYLENRAACGEDVEDEARQLAQKILQKPVGTYSGMNTLLRLYRQYISMDEAIHLAEEALQRHPESRFLKRAAAVCYKRRIFDERRNEEPKMIERAITLCKEVIALYPESSLEMQMNLAQICAKQNPAEAEQMFNQLLKQDLEAVDTQMLYNCYAKHFYFIRNDYRRSVENHMKAAEIPQPSSYRQNSIRELRKARDKNLMRREIDEFLETLPQ